MRLSLTSALTATVVSVLFTPAAAQIASPDPRVQAQAGYAAAQARAAAAAGQLRSSQVVTRGLTIDRATPAAERLTIRAEQADERAQARLDAERERDIREARERARLRLLDPGAEPRGF